MVNHESNAEAPEKTAVLIISGKSKRRENRTFIFPFDVAADQGRMTPGLTLWHLRRSTKGCEVPGTSKVDSM